VFIFICILAFGNDPFLYGFFSKGMAFHKNSYISVLKTNLLPVVFPENLINEKLRFDNFFSIFNTRIQSNKTNIETQIEGM
jgi:hypothetical protein